MKKFLTIFFMTLGVIFFILMLAGTYLFIVDPYDLKPLLFGQDSEVSESAEEQAEQTGETDKHPLLNETQEKTLETFGINPANLPSQITPEQEACFEEALGSERVEEIKAGDSPTAIEFFKARGCI